MNIVSSPNRESAVGLSIPARAACAIIWRLFLNVCKIEQNAYGGGHIITEMSYSWNPLYTAAVLETDWSKMPERIRAAEAAITNRLHEFSLDHGGTPEENQVDSASCVRTWFCGANIKPVVKHRSPGARQALASIASSPIVLDSVNFFPGSISGVPAKSEIVCRGGTFSINSSALVVTIAQIKYPSERYFGYA